MWILAIYRHGESEANKKWMIAWVTNSPLTPNGKKQMRMRAEQIKHIRFTAAYSSMKLRAQQSLLEILWELWIEKQVSITYHEALNENDLWDLEGAFVTELIKKYGREKVWQWLRSYDTKPPKWQSLACIEPKITNFTLHTIIPQLAVGRNLIATWHHNSIRTMVKVLLDISAEEIEKLELENAQWLFFRYKERKIIQIHEL